MKVSIPLILFVILCSCSTNQKDVKGYQDFVWGQSQDSVRTVLKSLKKQFTDIDSLNQIDVFDSLLVDPVGYIQILKEFSFSKNQLSEVTIHCYDFPVTKQDSIYFILADLMMSKYGKNFLDTITNPRLNFFCRQYEWRFLSTTICLYKCSGRDVSIPGLGIYYFPTKALKTNSSLDQL
jgi:hypothetical protein